MYRVVFALGKWNAFFQLYGFFALEVTQHDLHLVTIKGCYAFFFSLCFISLSIFDLDFSVALPDLWCFLPLTPVLNVCIDMRGVSLTMHFNSGTWQNRGGGGETPQTFSEESCCVLLRSLFVALFDSATSFSGLG